jgi:hypothetical protein
MTSQAALNAEINSQLPDNNVNLVTPAILRPVLHDMVGFSVQSASTYNVINYGVVGDGIANDSPALQAAHDAALANGGGIVVIGMDPNGNNTYGLGSTLNWSDRVGISGQGIHTCGIKALAALNPMIIWTNDGGGGDPANSIENFKIDGNNLALSGILVGFGQQFLVKMIEVQNCINDGVVLCQTQNSTFWQLFVQNCGLSNIRLAGTAWNNDFIRCGSNQPGNLGYHLLVRNSAPYNNLVNGGTHTLLNNRHNVYLHPIFERGNPTSIVRLEDDDGDNGFYEFEFQGGSAANPQVYIGSSSSDNMFFHGTISESTSGASFAFDNFGFNTQLRTITGIGWSAGDWIRNTAPGSIFVDTPLGSFGNINVVSGGATETILASIAGALNYQLASGAFAFSENGNDGLSLGPLMTVDGHIVPIAGASELWDLGNSARRFRSVNAKSVTGGDVTALIGSYVNMNNGAAGNTATLTNAPVAGNPTKWIPISDNGVTRYIPTW